MTNIFGVSFVLFWLIILVVMLVIEIATLGLTTIWFAGGALVAFVLSLFNVPFIVQLPAFLIVSLLLLIFTRPIAVKYFNKDRAKTNVESMIGRQAIVVSEIDNLQGIGRVTVGGQEWTARTEQAVLILKDGTVFVVKEVKGVKLIVEQRKEEN